MAFSPGKLSSVGCYSVRLSVDGAPHYFLLDAYVPGDAAGHPLCMHSKAKIEFWLQLLEKAYAKLAGMLLFRRRFERFGSLSKTTSC